MSYAGSVIGSSSNNFYADSIFRKAAAALPIVGIVVNVLTEKKLTEKISLQLDLDSSIKYLDIKRHYHIAGIVSKVLSIAIIVALYASGVLTAALPFTIGAMAIGVFMGSIGRDIYKIIQNRHDQAYIKGSTIQDFELRKAAITGLVSDEAKRELPN